MAESTSSQTTGGIIGSIIGGIIGFIIGGPAGASIGMGLGGLVGSGLDPAKGPDVFGPRLDDRAVQTSSNTANIGRAYGTVANKGNWIWARNNEIQEVATTRTVKQKTFGITVAKQKVTEYSYYVTGAIAFSLVPEGASVAVVRVWIGDTLVYNASSEDPGTQQGSMSLLEAAVKFAGSGSDVSRPTMRFHLGADDQEPDPAIVEDVGAENAPAYPGIFYVVLDELDLEPWGNNLARAEMKVEYTLSFSTNPIARIQNIPLLSDGTNQDEYPLIHNANLLDGDGLHVWRLGSWDDVAGNTDSKRKFHYLFAPNGKGLFIEEPGSEPAGSGVEYPEFRTMPKGKADTNIVLSTTVYFIESTTGQGIGYSPEFALYPATLSVFGFGWTDHCSSAPALEPPVSTARNPNPFPGFGSALEYVLTCMTGVGQLGYLPSHPNYNLKLNYIFNTAEQHIEANGISWSDGPPINIVRFTISYSGAVPPQFPFEIDDTFLTQTMGYTQLVVTKYDRGLDKQYSAIIDITNKAGPPGSDMMYVGYGGQVFFSYYIDASVSASKIRHLIKYDEDFVRVESIEVGANLNLTSMGILNGELVLVTNNGSNATIYVYSIDDLSLTQTISSAQVATIFGSSGPDLYNSISMDFNKILYSLSGNLYELTSFDGTPTNLGDVSGELITGSGEPEWFNIWKVGNFIGVATEGGALPNLGVQFFLSGVVTPGAVSLSQIISSECQLCSLTEDEIDVSQIDQEVRGYSITRRGSVRTVIDQLRTCFPFDYFMSGYKVKFVPRGQTSVAEVNWEDLGEDIQWTEDREMSSQLPYKVIFRYLDYDLEYEPNEQFSERFIDSETQQEIEIPIVFTPDECAKAVDIVHSIYLIERVMVPKLVLPPTFRGVEPSDVITVNISETESEEIRLTSVNNMSDGSIEVSARRNEVSIMNSNAVGQATKPRDQTIPVSGPSFVQLLDLPVLDLSENQPGFTAVMSGIYDNWTGGNLYETLDGGMTWEEAAGYSSNCTFGICTGTLAQSGGHIIDVAGSLIVNLYAGSLTTTDLDGLLANTNLAAYGAQGRWEIISFQNVLEDSDGQFTIDTFIRGLYGTEWATGLHQENDVLVMVEDIDNQFLPRSEDGIGSTFTFRGASIGKDIGSALDRTITYNAENLTPLSSVQGLGTRDASENFSGSFVPRGRVDNEWVNGQDVPVGEETEAYEIDVMTGSDSDVVVRTIEVSEPSFEYSAADQITDFGSEQSSITFRIYKMSTIVGRGRVYEVTL